MTYSLDEMIRETVIFILTFPHGTGEETNTCWTSEVPNVTGPQAPWWWWLRLGLKRHWKLRVKLRS